MGLRELKKEQTRRLLMETAWRLFTERGFDHVKVVEVAREAQVSEATVFKYFPTKEDLFYSGLEEFGARLVAAVAAREAGEPALAACRRFLLEANGGLLALIEAGDREAFERLKTVNRVIAASSALQAREQQAIGRYTDALAELLAADTGAPPGDPDAVVAAHAMIGVHRTLIAYVRRRVAEGDDSGALVADVRRVGARAFALLERGLGDYAVKPGSS